MTPLTLRNVRRTGLAGDRRGMVLALMLIFMGIMLMLALFLFRVVQNDARLLRQTQLRMQAENVAQAGLDMAFADIQANGFSNRANFTGSVGNETFRVTYRNLGVAATEWEMITSQATVGNVTAVLHAEIIAAEGRSALEFLTSGANYLEIFAQNYSRELDLTGEIHCNRDMYLFAQQQTAIDVKGQLSTGRDMRLRAGGDGGFIGITGMVVHPPGNPPTIEGNVSVGGGLRAEDLPNIRFPLLDWAEYRNAAIAVGWDFVGNQRIDGNVVWGAPGPGSVVFVDGDLRLSSHSRLTLRGSLIVTGDITMLAGSTFDQRWSGDVEDVNVVFALGGIDSTQGNLLVQRAVVCGITNFRIHERHNARLDVTGALMSQGNLVIHGSQAGLKYVHELLIPDHITSGGVAGFRVRSYNPSHQID